MIHIKILFAEYDIRHVNKKKLIQNKNKKRTGTKSTVVLQWIHYIPLMPDDESESQCGVDNAKYKKQRCVAFVFCYAGSEGAGAGSVATGSPGAGSLGAGAGSEGVGSEVGGVSD